MRGLCFIALTTLLVIVFVTTAGADTRPLRVDGNAVMYHGGSLGTKSARADTVHLIGNPQNPDHHGPGGTPPQVSGTFEDAAGQADWNGWTSEDASVQADIFWQISDFHAPSGEYAYWCGTWFGDDPGYGNNWRQILEFVHTVDDPSAASTVHWTATMRVDCEPSYDYVYLEIQRGDDWETLESYGLAGEQMVDVDQAIVLSMGEYGGLDGDEIRLRVRFESDGAWSDFDGFWDTDGALQIDDIGVMVDGVLVDFEDFEDQVSQRWTPVVPVGVGDFAHLHTFLMDEDPCVSNFSAQVAFVDDGVVAPGTGGTQGQTWRYGPGGFIVNNTGGLAGPEEYIDNVIVSPVVTWPEGLDQALLEFGVYVHEELGAHDVWPGVFYQWHVRSTDSGDPIELSQSIWRNRHFVEYGGPEYRRRSEVVTDLIAVGATHAQVGLRVIEYGYVWGWVGHDGTPAPYFDNVRLAVTEADGPAISGASIDFFEDGFPACGEIDLTDLANNSVRLDAARNIAHANHLRNDPGDSCWFDVKAVRSGSVLVESPRFHVRMKASPLFAPYRTLPPGFSIEQNFFHNGSDLITGYVEADSCFHHNWSYPIYVEDRWVVDLPDTGFFYPSDVIHWYIEARDNVGGDIGTTLLPADTSGFTEFQAISPYPLDCTVRALPTLESVHGYQPDALIWLEDPDHGGIQPWLNDLYLCGQYLGVDVDLYVTNGSSAGVGNGLGGRATPAHLDGYEALVYDCGDLSSNLLSNGDFEIDPSDDLELLTSWLEFGDKNLVVMGDNVVSATLDQGVAGAEFVNRFLGVSLADRRILGLISNQVSPLVRSMPGNGIFYVVDEWIANGGCPTLNVFDAVVPIGDAEYVAEFTDPNGNDGVYPYAAATLNVNSEVNATVLSLPYALRFFEEPPEWESPWGYLNWTLRTHIVFEIAEAMWHSGWIPPPGVNDTPEPLTVRNAPNPFNPTTTFELRVPQDGPVSLKLYSIRGELVRTLVDERLEGGLHQITWDGRDDGERAVASGVYFAETRAGGEVLVNKVALVR